MFRPLLSRLHTENIDRKSSILRRKVANVAACEPSAALVHANGSVKPYVGRSFDYWVVSQPDSVCDITTDTTTTAALRR